MEKDTAQTRTLKRALEFAGDAPALARLLKVEVPQLLTWLSGDQGTPNDVYLRALDIVSRGRPG